MKGYATDFMTISSRAAELGLGTVNRLHPPHYAEWSQTGSMYQQSNAGVCIKDISSSYYLIRCDLVDYVLRRL